MGFTVAESLTFSKFGVSATNCYVTIRGSYNFSKQGNGMSMMMPGQQSSSPYSMSARFLVYASNDKTLTPLREEMVYINLTDVPADPFDAIYSAVKTQFFAGKTFTDLIGKD